MGLLSLIPMRDYLWAALLIAIVSGFLWNQHHEREIGASRRAAADAALAHAQEIHNTEVETRAQTLTDKALADYVAAHAVPPVSPATPLVCYHTRPSEVPGTAGAATGSNGASSVPAEATGPPYDPSPAVLTDGRDADAQIKLLQDLIRSYQDAGVVAK